MVLIDSLIAVLRHVRNISDILLTRTHLSHEGYSRNAWCELIMISIFFNLSELKQEKGELVDGQHVLSQPIWLNPLIKIGGNMCMNKICCENGVFFVNDLISENKMLFTYEEFKNHYNIRLNFIEYFSILSAIPHRWKLLIRGIGKLKLIENDIIDR